MSRRKLRGLVDGVSAWIGTFKGKKENRRHAGVVYALNGIPQSPIPLFDGVEVEGPLWYEPPPDEEISNAPAIFQSPIGEILPS